MMTKKVIKAVFLLICIGSLIGFISMTDISHVMVQIQSIGYGFFGLMLLSALAHLCGTIAWRYCFQDSSVISVWALFIIRVIGENITLYNPTNLVAGEASKYQLLKKFKIEKKEGMYSILFSRMILIISHVLLIFICAVWVAELLGFMIPFFLALLFIVLLLFTIYSLFNSSLGKKVVNEKKEKFRFVRVLAIHGSRYSSAFRRLIKKKPKAFIMALIFSISHWLLGAAEIFLIIEFLNVPIGFLKSVVVDMGVVMVKSAGSFVPGQIGVEEMGNKWMLELAGVTGGVWVTVSILRRGKQLVWILLSALFYFIIRNYSYSKIQSNGYIISNT